MKRLEIPATNNTPHILLEADSTRLLIEGKSFPEDGKEFYRPLIEWIDGLRNATPKAIEITFNLYYLSSSSIIAVKQLLFKVTELNTKGFNINVVWCYDEDDDDIKKTGEDYERLTRLKFQYKINDIS
jgi:hypothetical protein